MRGNIVMIRGWMIPVCICLALAVADAAAAERRSFTVVSSAGVPQLRMDGHAVRSRLFWGSPFYSAGYAELSPESQTFEFSFRSPEESRVGALHLRFGEKPGIVTLEQVDIRDLTTGTPVRQCRFDDAFIREWNWWSVGIKHSPDFSITVEKAETPAGGIMKLRLSADPKLRGFHLLLSGLRLAKDHEYRVTVRAKADSPRPFRPTVHRQKDNCPVLGGLPSPFAAQAAMAAGAGINAVSFLVDGIWTEPGREPDYSDLDRICRQVLDANPNAFLLPRIRLDPPEWWRRAHPEELMKFEDGSRGVSAAFASERYRRDAAEALRSAIVYCEKKFGPHMMGYHPAGGNSCEWFYPGTWGKLLAGYDPATLAAWRKFLRRKYGSEAALRRAWGTGAESFDTVSVPPPAARRGTPMQGLRHPRRDAAVLDFDEFRQACAAEIVLALARTVRKVAGPGRLSVFFYGYVFEFGRVPNGPAASGHYALRRVLDSPDVDILAGPQSYTDRQLGGGFAVMTAAESVMLSGKLWLVEDDTGTHLATASGSRFSGWQSGAETQEESIALLRRNLAALLCRNYGTWWMDLGGTGWFNAQELWEVMREFSAPEEELLNHPVPFRPQVAVFVDERSMLYIPGSGSSTATTFPLVTGARRELNRIGAPCGQYLLDDLMAGRTAAKLNIFPAVFALDSETRRKLRKCAAQAAALWCWAPGYAELDGGTFSPAAVEELTGFRVKAARGPLHVRSTAAGRKAGLPPEFGPEAEIEPRLAVIPEKNDVVLAVYPDGAPAVVFRPGIRPQVFCGTTELPAPLLRYVAELAGVQLYTDRAANVNVNGPFIAVTACADGEVGVHIPQPVGRTLFRKLKCGETVLVRGEDGER